jgi:putative acetyltransferase
MKPELPVVSIRHENHEDIPLIYSVHEQTFKRDAEAKLTDKLREACTDCLSLVAEDNGTIVGHVMFTPVLIKKDKIISGMGLAPMAVLPSKQRLGIGTQLIKSGLQILQEKGCPFVIVLGHPEYYPRFGFKPASAYNIQSQWEDVPDDAFMILVLDHEAFQDVSGIAAFRDEFNEAL